MERCDLGRLKAYHDDALAPAEREAVAAHLIGCPACQQALAALAERSRGVAQCLTTLDPEPAAVPAARQALARFREAQRSHASAPSPVRIALQRSVTMIRETFGNSRWRSLAIGAAALACLVILFSFAPVRQAAADFLGIFRVRKFAVIPIDPTQQQKIEALLRQAEEGRFGAPTILREEGEPEPVADLAAASARVGFAVRAPTILPWGVPPLSLTVQAGPALRYEMDRAVIQALLEATQAQGIKLPAVDKITLVLDVPYSVIQEYGFGTGRLTIRQMASPQVDIPAGVDLTAIGEAGFKFLGIPDADALRLAQGIDWTSTLVIPLPTNVLQYREVTVDGVVGLLVEHRPAQSSRRAAFLLWQKDGVIYSITTRDVDPLVTMQVADSMR